MDRFARWVVCHRLLVVLAVGLLTIAGSVSIVLFSRVESDISKFLPPDDPVVIRFNQAGERFGGVAVAMVALESDKVFSHEGLQLVDRLTRAAKGIPGVSWVISLTDVDDVQQAIIDGEKAVSVKKLLQPDSIPKDPRELEKLRKYVLSKERLVGTVISEDGRVANIVVNISAEADRVVVARELDRRSRQIAQGEQLYFSGFPFWMLTMSDMIIGDMIVLVPFVTLIIMFILLLSFRSLRGVVLPLSTVLISSIWAMGLMAALDIPITTLSNAVPVLLIALGTAYAIHLLHKHNEVAGSGPGDNDGIQSAMADVMVPICLAGLTTVIGFLSFLTSSLVFIQQTGVIAAFGIFSAMLVTLTFLPAVLSWLKPRKGASVANSGTKGLFERLADHAGRSVIQHRRILLVISLIIAVVAAGFIPSLDRRFDMVAYFPEGSDVRKADDMMREKLGGNVPVWVTVDGPAKHPAALKSMLLIEKFLRNQPAVNNPKSIASLIAEINEVMNGTLGIPDTAQGVGNLWLNLEGKDVLKQFVDADQKHALIQAVCSTADTSRLRILTRKVDAFLESLPARLVEVNLDKVDQPLGHKAREYQLDRVAELVAFDIAFRLEKTNETFESETVRKWIQAGLDRKTAVRDPARYRERFLGLMLSDESDLEFPDDELAGVAATKLSTSFSEGRQEKKELEEDIRSVLAPDLLEEDPEAPSYLAQSIQVLGLEIDRNKKVDDLLAFLLQNLPSRIRGNKGLRRDLTGDLAELNDQRVFLPADPGAEGGDGSVIEMEFNQTGMHHISVNVDNRIVFSQLSSLALAVLMATLLLMIQFRSVLAGILGMIPMCLTLLINFGVMGAFRIDLEPATVLIASMVVGVGIDYTIHFMSRTRLEMLRRGEPASALDVTLRTAGRAILINAITVAGGQMVFLAGQMVPLRTFGILLALAMVVSAVSAVTVMPAVLMAARPRFLLGKESRTNLN